MFGVIDLAGCCAHCEMLRTCGLNENDSEKLSCACKEESSCESYCVGLCDFSGAEK